MFHALEGMYGHMFPKERGLNVGAARKNLEPLTQKLYAGNRPALGAAAKLLSGLEDWINAAHFYRHERGASEVVEPLFALAVNLVSLSSSYLRWLVELNEQGTK